MDVTHRQEYVVCSSASHNTTMASRDRSYRGNHPTRGFSCYQTSGVRYPRWLESRGVGIRSLQFVTRFRGHGSWSAAQILYVQTERRLLRVHSCGVSLY